MSQIAVGVDFSSESDLAVDHAMDAARRSGAGVLLIHVGVILDPPVELPASMQLTADAWQGVLAARLAADRNRLEELRGRRAGQGVEVSHVVVDGYADVALTEAAAAMGAELLVVGTHGRTGFRRLVLGSIAEKAVRLASISVLVARGDAPVGGYHRVVVGTDFSPLARIALEQALARVAPSGHLRVIHAWHPRPTIADVAPEVVAGLHEAAETRCDQLRAEIATMPRPDGVTFSVEVADGTPAAALDAVSEGVDLLVVGSHGRRGVRRFLLGSVAEATVRHARCSVLVAR